MPNASPRIAIMRGSENSSPSVNTRNTTPNSASDRREAVAGEIQRVGTEQHADGEVAEDRRQPQAAEQQTTRTDEASSISSCGRMGDPGAPPCRQSTWAMRRCEDGMLISRAMARELLEQVRTGDALTVRLNGTGVSRTSSPSRPPWRSFRRKARAGSSSTRGRWSRSISPAHGCCASGCRRCRARAAGSNSQANRRRNSRSSKKSPRSRPSSGGGAGAAEAWRDACRMGRPNFGAAAASRRAMRSASSAASP